MPENNADELIKRQGQLKSDRANFETQWQEIAELMSPFRSDFIADKTDGEKRMQKIFDGSPGIALENLAAGLWGSNTNSALDWFELETEEPGLNEEFDVQLWLEQATRALRGLFANNGQQFYGQQLDLNHDLCGFGTGVFYIEEDPDRFIRFATRHLAECYLAANEAGQVDTVFRRYKLSARQAVQKFGKARLCEAVLKAAENQPDTKFEFLHCVLPAAEYERGRSKGKPVASVNIDVTGRSVLTESGYHEMPYTAPRWSTRSRAVYGDAPAMLALPDTKMLNQMSKVTIVSAQKQADPAVLAHDQLKMRGVRMTPGQVFYGGVDAQGRQMVAPFVTGGNINLGLEIENQRRQAVQTAFFASLLLLTSDVNQTATQYLGEQAERIRMFAPYLGRIQTEHLSPTITRVFNIAMRASRAEWIRGGRGIIPPPPEALQGQQIRIRYTSPLDRQQKSSEAVSVSRFVEAAGAVIQIDPDARDVINGDETLRILADGFGAPKRMLNDPATIDANRQQRAAQAAASMVAGAAPGMAKAALDSTKAAEELQNMGALPQQQQQQGQAA